MTIAITMDGFFSPHTDRGISNEAETLLKRITEVRDEFSETETLGKSYRETLEALLERYRECSSEDWDGYGAKAATEANFIAAVRFLETLPTTIVNPEISIDPDGEFAFEWYHGKRNLLSVSIGSQGRITYAARFGRARIHGTEYFGDELPGVITSNLERLYS